jgi:hypothetical protein
MPTGTNGVDVTETTQQNAEALAAYQGVMDERSQSVPTSGTTGHSGRVTRNKLPTAALVQIIAVTNAGGVGFVDVRLMVNPGDGNPIAHATIHTLPYLRHPVMMDHPAVGDIGMAIFGGADGLYLGRHPSP